MVTLTEDQERAEKLITEWFFNLDNQVFVLAGYAGTGKTFLLSRIVDEILHLKAGTEAVFVTPTGKAASVLVKNGVPAGTVHSLIYIRDEEDFDVDENGEIVKDKALTFRKREKIGEKIKLIVIDEASMISEDVLRDILSFGMKCLFCGDTAQLPPVNGICSVLASPDITLTTIVRQAENNPIIRVASMARKGEFIPYGNYGTVSVIGKSQFRGEERKRIMTSFDQIVCGRNRTREALNAEMRRYLHIDPDEYLPTENEKLICTLNDWDKPIDHEKKFYLVNGVIGRANRVVESLDDLAVMDFTADFTDETVRVPFDTGIFSKGDYTHFYGDKAVKLSNGLTVHEGNFPLLHRFKAVDEEQICRFEFAYAVTCHKAQGSEFPSVVVFDESWAFGEEKNRWLYTAVTRAKERLIIIR